MQYEGDTTVYSAVLSDYLDKVFPQHCHGI